MPFCPRLANKHFEPPNSVCQGMRRSPLPTIDQFTLPPNFELKKRLSGLVRDTGYRYRCHRILLKAPGALKFNPFTWSHTSIEMFQNEPQHVPRTQLKTPRMNDGECRFIVCYPVKPPLHGREKYYLPFICGIFVKTGEGTDLMSVTITYPLVAVPP